MSFNPRGRYAESNTQKRSTGSNWLAAKPVRRSVTLDPWGMYAAGKKKWEPEGSDLLTAKPDRRFITGNL